MNDNSALNENDDSEKQNDSSTRLENDVSESKEDDEEKTKSSPSKDSINSSDVTTKDNTAEQDAEESKPKIDAKLSLLEQPKLSSKDKSRRKDKKHSKKSEKVEISKSDAQRKIDRKEVKKQERHSKQQKEQEEEEQQQQPKQNTSVMTLDLSVSTGLNAVPRYNPTRQSVFSSRTTLVLRSNSRPMYPDDAILSSQLVQRFSDPSLADHLPDILRVALPIGLPAGITLVDKPYSAENNFYLIHKHTPYILFPESVPPGMVVDTIIIPQTKTNTMTTPRTTTKSTTPALPPIEYRGYAAEDLSTILTKSISIPNRVLILKNPFHDDLPKFATIKLYLPSHTTAEHLGLTISSERDTKAILQDVSESSPFNNTLSVGQRILAVGLSDGTYHDKLTGFRVRNLLLETCSLDGRYLIVKHYGEKKLKKRTQEHSNQTANQTSKEPQARPRLLTALSETWKSSRSHLMSSGAISKRGLFFSKQRDSTRNLQHGWFDSSQRSGTNDVSKPSERRSQSVPKARLTTPAITTNKSLPSSETPNEEAVQSLSPSHPIKQRRRSSNPETFITQRQEPLQEISADSSETLTLDLPTGLLGIAFANKDQSTIVLRFLDNSPLKGKFAHIVGMVVDSITLTPGVQLRGLAAAELRQSLTDTKHIKGRKLHLKSFKSIQHSIDPDENTSPSVAVSSKDVSREPSYLRRHSNPETSSTQKQDQIQESSTRFPDTITLDLPTGLLGIAFANERQSTTVLRFLDNSPLQDKFPQIVGMAVDSLTLPHGMQLRGLVASELRQVLNDTNQLIGRKLILRNPFGSDLPTLSTTKIWLPTLPPGDDWGIAWEDASAMVKSVASSSPLFQLLSKGQLVLSVGLANGHEYKMPTGEEVTYLLKNSSLPQFMLLKNVIQRNSEKKPSTQNVNPKSSRNLWQESHKLLKGWSSRRINTKSDIASSNIPLDNRPVPIMQSAGHLPPQKPVPELLDESLDELTLQPRRLSAEQNSSPKLPSNSLSSGDSSSQPTTITPNKPSLTQRAQFRAALLQSPAATAVKENSNSKKKSKSKRSRRSKSLESPRSSQIKTKETDKLSVQPSPSILSSESSRSRPEMLPDRTIKKSTGSRRGDLLHNENPAQNKSHQSRLDHMTASKANLSSENVTAEHPTRNNWESTSIKLDSSRMTLSISLIDSSEQSGKRVTTTRVKSSPSDRNTKAITAGVEKLKRVTENNAIHSIEGALNGNDKEDPGNTKLENAPTKVNERDTGEIPQRQGLGDQQTSDSKHDELNHAKSNENVIIGDIANEVADDPNSVFNIRRPSAGEVKPEKYDDDTVRVKTSAGHRSKSKPSKKKYKNHTKDSNGANHKQAKKDEDSSQEIHDHSDK